MGASSLNMYTGGVLGLVTSASPMAKVIIGILLVFSILSWTIMLMKLKQFGRVEKEGARFLAAARETNSFGKLLSSYRDSPDNPFYKLMIVTYKEISAKQKDNPKLEPETLPLIENVLRITISEESETLERRMSFLGYHGKHCPVHRIVRNCLGHDGLFQGDRGEGDHEPGGRRTGHLVKPSSPPNRPRHCHTGSPRIQLFQQPSQEACGEDGKRFHVSH